MMGRGRRRASVGKTLMGLVVAAVLPVLILGIAWGLVSSAHGRSASPVPMPTDIASAAAAPVDLRPPRILPLRPVRVTAAPVPTVSVRIANFNLYGCTESAPSWPSCTDRFPRQWDYINRHDLSIVGLQELEPAPFAMFRDNVDARGSGWAMYPAKPVFVHQQTTGVLWRSDQWRLVRSGEFEIPKYTWHDSSGAHTVDAEEAAVLLQSRTGVRVWVLSVHNMSSENAGFASGLAQDEAIEARQFAARSRGHVPVVLLGDFNDDTDAPICAVLGPTVTQSPSPTAVPSPSAHSIWGPVPPAGCTNPGKANGQPYDKIIASGDVRFINSGIDWSTQKIKLTDHGIAWVEAVLK